jgi:deoxyribodipyrimidine photo-lyase
MKRKTALVWFRQDLRLADQPALAAALEQARPVVPVYIWGPEEEGRWAPGGASKLWLHDSLQALDARLRERGSRLILRRGAALPTLLALAREAGASAVYWNRRYEPVAIERDRLVKDGLRAAGLAAESFNGALLKEPWTVQNKSGKPFQVFTAFWRACLAEPDPARPLREPERLDPVDDGVKSLPLEALELNPRLAWGDGIRRYWEAGEHGAAGELKRFLKQAFTNYSADRNRPDRPGTSRLSPYLHAGQLTPRQVWAAVQAHARREGLETAKWRHSQFLAELGWREFAHHLLYHFPHTTEEPLRPDFKHFPWRPHEAGLAAWQRGQTGIPLVDAGMRQLWATGWMHNRVRMVVASFLVKNLLVSWQDGARWFWDTLVDADLASNTLGWQWTAGCGADAAPYFRVFNPASQAEKFDPAGDYIRQWVPELARLPAQWIGHPALAPAEELRRAGVKLGHTYPDPIVSLVATRHQALEAFAAIKRPPSAPAQGA